MVRFPRVPDLGSDGMLLRRGGDMELTHHVTGRTHGLCHPLRSDTKTELPTCYFLTESGIFLFSISGTVSKSRKNVC